MRIVLHIGPHKTGTTSIQTHLAALLCEPAAGGYWYPVPGGQLGPGHADLARACLWEERPAAELNRVIATAQAAEVGTLILSSEEFAHAFPVREFFARLKIALAGHEIHLVVTLNEIGRRAGSIWQELLKHGRVVGLEKGIEQILSREPALQPHLTRKFIDALAPHETSVVLSHHRAPAAELLTNLCRAIGVFEAMPGTEAATHASTLLLNQSLGATEAQILRSVNSWVHQAVGDLSKIPYSDVRDLYMNLFNTPTWRNSVPFRPITIPVTHAAEVLNRGRQELDDLRKLADEGRAKIFGDLDTVEAALDVRLGSTGGTENKVVTGVVDAGQENAGYHEIAFASREFKLAKFRSSEFTERQLKAGTWEAPLPIMLMAMVARTKGIFVDVGGNYGVYTILAGITRADVEIHTFEPFREAFDVLHQNAALNGIKERVTIHDVALSDSAGQAKLHLPDPSHGLLETSASLEAEFKKRHAGYLPVETKTLDSYSFDQPISVVKIDVEGHEHAVIKGARRMLVEDRPVIFAEMLSGAKKHFFEISKLMADHGYVNFRMRVTCLIETPIIVFDRLSPNYAFVPQEMMPTLRLVCATHGLEILTEYKK